LPSILCAALEHMPSCSCSFYCCSTIRMFDTDSQAPCRSCSLRSPLQGRSPAPIWPRHHDLMVSPGARHRRRRTGRAGEEATGNCEVAGAATPASPAAPGSQGPVESSPAPRYPGLELSRPLRPQSRLRWGRRGCWRPTSAGLPGWP